MIAHTPKPPYFAVIFTTIRTNEQDGYPEMAERMVALARKQDGFLGEESSRTEVGITVSYWKDEASIMKWKQNSEHQIAQKIGKEKWYKAFKLRVAKVEREYGFEL